MTTLNLLTVRRHVGGAKILLTNDNSDYQLLIRGLLQALMPAVELWRTATAEEALLYLTYYLTSQPVLAIEASLHNPLWLFYSILFKPKAPGPKDTREIAVQALSSIINWTDSDNPTIPLWSRIDSFAKGQVARSH